MHPSPKERDKMYLFVFFLAVLILLAISLGPK